MKIIYRRLLQFSGLVVFLATAPLIVFYAMGYRFSTQSIDPLPVGVLLIESIPRRAEVLIDNEFIGTTPRSISNLRPGTVDVAVRKAGYQEWRKELPIVPTVVTEARSILLIPTDLKSQIVTTNVQQFSVSPNRQLIAATYDDRTLHIIDESGKEITAPIRLINQVEALFWSPDSRNILLVSKNNFHIVTLSTISLGARQLPLATRNIKDIVWDPRIPGRLVVLDDKNIVSAYSIDTRQLVPLIAGVKTFATSSRNIYSVNDADILTVHDLQGQVTRTFPIPFEKEIVKLHVTPAGRIAIQFIDNSVGVVDDNNQINIVTTTSQTLGWSPDGQLLLVQTEPGALYVYNAVDERLSHLPVGKSQLVVRLSRPIHSAQWFAGGRHLIYQSEDEIVITEIDTRNHAVTYTLDTTNLGESKLAVGKNGEVLLYLKRTDSTTNLVALPLLVE